MPLDAVLVMPCLLFAGHPDGYSAVAGSGNISKNPNKWF
jgi:hypothetical protein